jgi:hypothetical protein
MLDKIMTGSMESLSESIPRHPLEASLVYDSLLQ